MDISIITPIYNGNKYLNSYLKMIEEATSIISDVEVIWVNDSPDISIEYDEQLAKNIDLQIIENEKNSGIHKSRVNGLTKAKGEYILFLDQDDEITKDCLLSQYTKVQEHDLVIGNGYFEDENGSHKIFENEYSLKFATKKKPYILVRDFIVSPGQCLIKKQAIPKEWKENTLKNNGTDDFLLWLLMFNKECKVTMNFECVYKHKYTGENVSLETDNMYKSQLELLEVLAKNDSYNKKDLKKLERTIKYKHNYKANFVKETLKNIDIFCYNIIYRAKWKGYTLPNGKDKK